ncbi:helix-turn-helix domain-containing protein [Aurantiacibacter sp. MUD61]|uniref:helix-turn-helix domain-containing protein n=1 Tax=Aurantiacibacter sp. MUD61 TaxID=3009083 RepID=UPI0022EFF7B1|nr:XRE family transcriptional regulator [Aurantiacibacter sp. MUD61]
MEFAGEQLRLARLAHGLSLEEVAERIATSRQFIHQLENGSRSASTEHVEILAEALGVTEDFFADLVPSTVRPEQCHFRGLSSRPAYVTSQVLARGTLLDKLVASIEGVLSLPTVDFPDIPVSNFEEIEQAAEAARIHWKLGSTGPIKNMMRVVENAGAVVTYFEDLSEKVDAFSMDRRRPIIVRSSLKQSLFRQRFDLAHECGHLIMHRGIQTGDQATEKEAHRFAGAFLFPRGAVLREFPRGKRIDWQALYKLKLRWRMSVSAIVRRAFDLRILTPAQYRTANIYLRKTGQSKVEKFDNDGSLPLEYPELLPKVIDALDEAIPGGVLSVGMKAGLKREMLVQLTGIELNPSAPISSADNVIQLHPNR